MRSDEQPECDVRQQFSVEFTEPKKRGRPIGSTRQESVRGSAGSSLLGAAIHGRAGLMAATATTNSSAGLGVSDADDFLCSLITKTPPQTPRKTTAARANLTTIRAGIDQASAAPRKIAKVARKFDPRRNDDANCDNGRDNGHSGGAASGIDSCSIVQPDLNDDDARLIIDECANQGC